jgi:hypothetical protein
MESLIVSAKAHYRLLFVQPDPERGDRVCIGVLFNEGGRRHSVLYDRSFKKVRCIAPDADTDVLSYYVTDFSAAIETSKDLDATLKRYTPQLTASADRNIVAPLTDRLRQLLFRRFAMLSAEEEHEAVAVREDSVPYPTRTSEEIATFAQGIALPLETSVIRNARPIDLIGKRVSLIRPVAAAIRLRHSVVLMDGIDLRLGRPRAGVNRVNKVVHTFWQYEKLKSRDMSAGDIRRVGIVLNGAEPTSRASAAEYSDAHDYALAQFTKGADLAIDGSSPDDRRRLQNFLLSQ